MEILLLLLVLFLNGNTLALWNDLNCPAPRAPENGLSFIFRNGELVHFRCHPGYYMSGKAVSYCLNSHWSAPTPDCLPIHKDNRDKVSNHENYYSYQPNYQIPKSNYKQPLTNEVSREELNSNLFNWDNKPKKKGVYGDGPRRLPLINGIWPKEQDQKIMSLGPLSTPGPMNLVKEEVNIAELRNRQYQEVVRHHDQNLNLDLIPKRRRKGNRKGKGGKRYHKNSVLSPDMNREMVLTLATTEDGDALSVASSKMADTDRRGHRYRHREQTKRKRKGLKKWEKRHKKEGHADNLISRSSRVDSAGPIYTPMELGMEYHRSRHQHREGTAEFRRMPVQEVTESSVQSRDVSSFDTSCVESFYGRDLPMIAPYVPNAFVYSYETKKLADYPHNAYMQVNYKCLSGYTFENQYAHTLKCREALWVGEMPRCRRLTIE